MISCAKNPVLIGGGKSFSSGTLGMMGSPHVLRDTFAGVANGTNLSGRTPEIGPAGATYTIAGTWTIESSRIDRGGTTAATDKWWISHGLPENTPYTLYCDLRTQSGDTTHVPALLLNLADTNNYVRVGFFDLVGAGRKFAHADVVGGVITTVQETATGAALANATTYQVKVEVWGKNVKCYLYTAGAWVLWASWIFERITYTANVGGTIAASASTQDPKFTNLRVERGGGENYLPIDVQASSGPTGHRAFPSLERLTDGTLVGVYRRASAHVGVDGVLHIVFSYDGGSSWSEPAMLNDDAGGNDSRANDSLTLMSDGRLLLAYALHNGTVTVGCQVRFSEDGGATWDAAIDVDTPAGYDWIFPYGRVRELAADHWLMPVYGLQTASGKTDALLLESEDYGETWTLRSVVAASASLNFNEWTLQHATGSTWYAWIRTHDSGGFNVTNMRRTVSTDNGATWAAVTDLGASYVYVSPSVIKDYAGTYWLFVGDRATSANQGTKVRKGTDPTSLGPAMTVAYVHTGPDQGYPSVVDFGDGFLGCMYYTDTSFTVRFRKFRLV